MFGVLLLTIVPPAQVARPDLAAAYDFGVSRQVAEANADLALRHRDAVNAFMREWLGEWGHERWRQDMYRRRRVWACLAEALDDRWPPAWRAGRLAEVEETLGDEAFAARWLPWPIPCYPFTPEVR